MSIMDTEHTAAGDWPLPGFGRTIPRHETRERSAAGVRGLIFSEKGRKTPLAIRFSTVIGGRDASEVAPAIRAASR
jgi:hypothetical protein